MRREGEGAEGGREEGEKEVRRERSGERGKEVWVRT